MKKYYKVIVETSEKDRPYDFEMSAAILVAEYFETDVVFLRPTPLKSPDLKIITKDNCVIDITEIL